MNEHNERLLPINTPWLEGLVQWTSVNTYKTGGKATTFFEVIQDENSDTIFQVSGGNVWAKDGKHGSEVSIANCVNRGELVDLLKALRVDLKGGE